MQAVIYIEDRIPSMLLYMAQIWTKNYIYIYNTCQLAKITDRLTTLHLEGFNNFCTAVRGSNGDKFPPYLDFFAWNDEKRTVAYSTFVHGVLRYCMSLGKPRSCVLPLKVQVIYWTWLFWCSTFITVLPIVGCAIVQDEKPSQNSINSTVSAAKVLRMIVSYPERMFP